MYSIHKARRSVSLQNYQKFILLTIRAATCSSRIGLYNKFQKPGEIRFYTKLIFQIIFTILSSYDSFLYNTLSLQRNMYHINWQFRLRSVSIKIYPILYITIYSIHYSRRNVFLKKVLHYWLQIRRSISIQTETHFIIFLIPAKTRSHTKL